MEQQYKQELTDLLSIYFKHELDYVQEKIGKEKTRQAIYNVLGAMARDNSVDQNSKETLASLLDKLI